MHIELESSLDDGSLTPWWAGTEGSLVVWRPWLGGDSFAKAVVLVVSYMYANNPPNMIYSITSPLSGIRQRYVSERRLSGRKKNPTTIIQVPWSPQFKGMVAKNQLQRTMTVQ